MGESDTDKFVSRVSTDEPCRVRSPLPSRSQPSSTAPFPSPLPNDTRSAPSTSINSSNHPIKRLSSSVNPEPSPKRSRIGVAPNASAFQAAYAAMFEASSLPPPNNAQYDPKSPSFSHQQPLPPSPVLHQRRPSQSTLSSRQPVLVGPLATACMTVRTKKCAEIRGSSANAFLS